MIGFWSMLTDLIRLDTECCLTSGQRGHGLLKLLHLSKPLANLSPDGRRCRFSSVSSNFLLAASFVLAAFNGSWPRH